MVILIIHRATAICDTDATTSSYVFHSLGGVLCEWPSCGYDAMSPDNVEVQAFRVSVTRAHC